MQQANQVKDLFYHMRDTKDQEVVKRDVGKGSGILIILDGLDGLPHLLLSEQSSLQIFFLVRCSVMPLFWSLADPLLHSSC